LRGDHWHLNIITVGWDQFSSTSPSSGGLSDREDRDARLDYAVYRCHEIYQQQSIGIGRIRFFRITAANAQGLDSLATDDDLDELTDAFTVDNDGLDHFIPFSMSIPSGDGILTGRSNINGPCDKEDPGGEQKSRDASVTGLWGSLQLARTFAHENGHYLGLRHPLRQNNKPMRLMTQSGAATNNGGSLRDSVELTDREGRKIGRHCSVQDQC